VADREDEVFTFTLEVSKLEIHGQPPKVYRRPVKNAKRDICTVEIRVGGERRARAILRSMREALRRHLSPVEYGPLSQAAGIRRVSEQTFLKRSRVSR
jgi:hypothetical protein